MQTATVLDHQKCPKDTDCSKIVVFYIKLIVKNSLSTMQYSLYTKKLYKNNLPSVLKRGHWGKMDQITELYNNRHLWKDIKLRMSFDEFLPSRRVASVCYAFEQTPCYLLQSW
jgi:PleD family two-component response regulator